MTNQSPIDLLQAAYNQIADVSSKAEETWIMLNQQINQVRDQRIGLSAQKQMLAELITRIKQQEEANKLTPPIPTV